MALHDGRIETTTVRIVYERQTPKDIEDLVSDESETEQKMDQSAGEHKVKEEPMSKDEHKVKEEPKSPTSPHYSPCSPTRPILIHHAAHSTLLTFRYLIKLVHCIFSYNLERDTN